MAVAIDFDAVRCAGRPVPAPTLATSTRAAIGLLHPTVEFSCLVVTGDAALGRRLSAAAELVGWDFTEAPRSTEALVEACDRDHRLVIVDLKTPPEGDLDTFHAAVRELVSRPDTLLVVCGVADDRSQETWARSLGAFVFVPGIAAGDPLVSVLREARTVSERRHRDTTVHAPQGARRLAGVRG